VGERGATWGGKGCNALHWPPQNRRSPPLTAANPPPKTQQPAGRGVHSPRRGRLCLFHAPRRHRRRRGLGRARAAGARRRCGGAALPGADLHPRRHGCGPCLWHRWRRAAPRAGAPGSDGRGRVWVAGAFPTRLRRGPSDWKGEPMLRAAPGGARPQHSGRGGPKPPGLPPRDPDCPLHNARQAAPWSSPSSATSPCGCAGACRASRRWWAPWPPSSPPCATKGWVPRRSRLRALGGGAGCGVLGREPVPPRLSTT
jgi:hypothetical protein